MGPSVLCSAKTLRSVKQKAFPFLLPFASLVRAVGRLSGSQGGRERSQIGAVRMERQEVSEKFLPARSPGGSAGSWPTSTLLARIPAPFGVPKGHSPLVTAALCSGNTSWDVLSRVSGADHSLCQATTTALSLQPSGPASLQDISEEKTTSQALSTPEPSCPREGSVPDDPPTAATGQSRGKHEERGEAPWAKPLLKLLCFETIRMDHGNALKHTQKTLLPPKSGAFWGLSTQLAVWPWWVTNQG